MRPGRCRLKNRIPKNIKSHRLIDEKTHALMRTNHEAFAKPPHGPRRKICLVLKTAIESPVH